MESSTPGDEKTEEKTFAAFYRGFEETDNEDLLLYRNNGRRSPYKGVDLVVHLKENNQSLRDILGLRCYMQKRFADDPRRGVYVTGEYTLAFAVDESSKVFRLRIQFRSDEGRRGDSYTGRHIQTVPLARWNSATF